PPSPWPLPATARSRPYTTLFRSPDGGVQQRPKLLRGDLERPQVTLGAGHDDRALQRADHQHRETLGPLVRDAHGPQSVGQRLGPDRKSTRLNSSHEWISYAVFCW